LGAAGHGLETVRGLVVVKLAHPEPTQISNLSIFSISGSQSTQIDSNHSCDFKNQRITEFGDWRCDIVDSTGSTAVHPNAFGQEMFGHGLPVKSASFASNLLATASGDA